MPKQEKRQGVHNLRKVRRIAGLTQEKLAKIVGIAQGTAKDAENGIKPYSHELVKKIANRLGCGYVRDSGNGLPGLSATRIDTSTRIPRPSDEPYTHQWFLEWNERYMRRLMYSNIFKRYTACLQEIMEAAGDLDAKDTEDSNNPQFHTSDAFVHALFDNLDDLVDSDGLAEAFSKRKLLNLENFSIEEELDESHARYKALKSELGTLKPRD
ncbi:hypothetical protein DDZ13_08205 [Coraliomargarita sinensis]|uniref:HTH cro/C1-type domain-containing protein n=1 Tax=Coraliomargarita sinensis TaxID=2174842 RepID=A0A317ZJE3_9BACT|nr:helix-turn-helix transcriptional regulator [Coraliomargarita sinensis]PXA04018.1 hypothetical protein DDZ13_08205 [Coraliomargarita sinensis]